MKQAIEKLTLEEAMAGLEKIVAELEKGEVTLEKSLARFEEGIALGKRCRDLLQSAEARVRQLVDVADDGTPIDGGFTHDG